MKAVCSHAGNVTDISSKAVAAKAAAKSAAEDLQGDTDESAAVTQSQMPVDVAAQLQQAQQLAQQQAADFKENNEGTKARPDASASTSAGSTLGLSTGGSSAADPTALSADASIMDPAAKLQLAQQHQSQQAATFKQNNEGTAARLDTASSAAAALAGGATSKVDSANKQAGGSSSEAGTKYSGVTAGGLPDATEKLGNVEAAKSASGAGSDGVTQTANTADATKSLSESVSAAGNDASIGVAAGSTAATMGISNHVNEAASSGTAATNNAVGQDNAATGAVSHADGALVAQDQAGQTQGVSVVDQDPSANAQTLPNSVSVTR